MARPGPKTNGGKEIVRLNAVKHGVLSMTPVIPGLERPEDWEAHRTGIIASLAPSGYLEQTLAERIALLFWRLQRVARYERESTSLALERVEEDLTGARRNGFAPTAWNSSVQNIADGVQNAQFHNIFMQFVLKAPDEQPMFTDVAALILRAIARGTDKVDLDSFPLPGIPEGVPPEQFTRWTSGLLRKGIDAILADSGEDPITMLFAGLEKMCDDVNGGEDTPDEGDTHLDKIRRERLLLEEGELNKVMRYEAHLSRLLRQDLHELEALQERRRGGVAPLARVDVQGLPEG